MQVQHKSQGNFHGFDFCVVSRSSAGVGSRSVTCSSRILEVWFIKSCSSVINFTSSTKHLSLAHIGISLRRLLRIFFLGKLVMLGYNNDIDCKGKRFYNVGNYTNNNQLITGVITEGRYLRKDQAIINMNGKSVTNARNRTNNNDLPTKAYVDTRSGNVDLTPFLKKGWRPTYDK